MRLRAIALVACAAILCLPAYAQRPSFFKQHDALAQVLAGTQYLDGRGVEKNFDEGIRRIERAARDGYALARQLLAIIYAEGLGTPSDPLKGAAHLAGAQSGQAADAYYDLGTLYWRGLRIEKEERPAVSWIMGRLGTPDDLIAKYFDSQRVHSDYSWGDLERAITWYRKAAAAGHVGAQVNLGVIFLDSRYEGWNCSEGMRWMKAAAERGDPTAQFNVGFAYLRGPERSSVRIGIGGENVPDGVRIGNIEAGGAAAGAGLRAGDTILSVNGTSLKTYGMEDLVAIVQTKRTMNMLVKRTGADVPQSIVVVPQTVTLKCPGAEEAGLREDAAQAFSWFEKAAGNGHPSGLFYVATAYREGKGVARDHARAMELYRKGAEHGDWESAQAISHMYFNGEGVEKNRELGEQWHRRALQLRHQRRN